MNRDNKDIIEYITGIMCTIAAITIGIIAIYKSKDNDINAGVLIFIAQLLIFSASVFHLNYKLKSYGSSNNNKR